MRGPLCPRLLDRVTRYALNTTETKGAFHSQALGRQLLTNTCCRSPDNSLLDQAENKSDYHHWEPTVHCAYRSNRVADNRFHTRSTHGDDVHRENRFDS